MIKNLWTYLDWVSSIYLDLTKCDLVWSQISKPRVHKRLDSSSLVPPILDATFLHIEKCFAWDFSMPKRPSTLLFSHPKIEKIWSLKVGSNLIWMGYHIWIRFDLIHKPCHPFPLNSLSFVWQKGRIGNGKSRWGSDLSWKQFGWGVQYFLGVGFARGGDNSWRAYFFWTIPTLTLLTPKIKGAFLLCVQVWN